MKYKEFNAWCNERACDGCWGIKEAMFCIDTCSTMMSVPFWKREKAWREYEHREVAEKVVAETNKIIEKMKQDTVF